MKFTTVLANGFLCMSNWLERERFYMVRSAIRDDTICNLCTRHCGVRVFYLNKNFSETGKTAI